MPIHPNFFLVGGAKCGTTAMYEHLAEHPEVFLPGHKEPCFFADDLPWEPGDTRIADLESYLRLFDGAAEMPVVGEASPSYLYSAVAAERVAEFAPGARIVIIVRHPVEVMWSLHRYLLAHGLEHEADFERALELEGPRRSGEIAPRRPFMMRRWLWYRDVARHAPQVQRFVDRFPREQLHVIVHDDLRLDPEGTWRSLLRFLEIDDSVPFANRRVNDAVRVRSARGRDLLRHPPRAVGAVARVLPARWRWRIRTSAMRALVTPAGPSAPSAELRGRLTAEAAADITRLGVLIDRDLSGWLDVPR